MRTYMNVDGKQSKGKKALDNVYGAVYIFSALFLLIFEKMCFRVLGSAVEGGCYIGMYEVYGIDL